MQDHRSIDSFNTLSELQAGSTRMQYHRLDALGEQGIGDVSRLPVSIRILLESLLRCENAADITRDDIIRLAQYDPRTPQAVEIPFRPSRVLLQDFTGVPCVVDLAAMRSAMARMGGDPSRINPRIPVDLVIDHSVRVDACDSAGACDTNTALEFDRNRERYEFLKWGQASFRNFRVIPPARGICHQINLEHLAAVVRRREQPGLPCIFFDSVVGTDSHTTMINGLGVAGWGVGGIEAEAVMLGQPLYMLAPPVVGFRLTGKLTNGSNATDLVLTITEMLRGKGVVGAFVEFYGEGLDGMTVPDRATVANMAPEYGATMGFFPVDAQTLHYLRATGRSAAHVAIVEAYCRAQGVFRTGTTPAPVYQDTLELDITTVRPCLAGPNRPQDRIGLGSMQQSFRKSLSAPACSRGFELAPGTLRAGASVRMPDGSLQRLKHGSIVICAITSCTNTSNPALMIEAGLLAKKAVRAGLRVPAWVKTSIAPGSTVTTRYLRETGLLPYLETLGFFVAGYGCMTCIGNSGPLPQEITRAIRENGLVAAGVVSANRNFEGRVHSAVRASFLASPALVVAYALAGTVDRDLVAEPLGYAPGGEPVRLADIRPDPEEITQLMEHAVVPELFVQEYRDIEHSNSRWNALSAAGGSLFGWQDRSTYIREPAFFTGMPEQPGPIEPIAGARVLVMAGHSITTDHISPAGDIASGSPAGRYLEGLGIGPDDFNSYGSRRGNHHVMMRGTFANIRFRNLLAPGKEASWTRHQPSGDIMSIYDAAVRYGDGHVPVLVIAGRDYGMGSSRDWAAKGTCLLGVRAVIAESFERIHRSNLVHMGILPLQFQPGRSAGSLGLTGTETYTVHIDDSLRPGQDIGISVCDAAGSTRELIVCCRLDSPVELSYYRNGGILQAVLRRFLAEGP